MAFNGGRAGGAKYLRALFARCDTWSSVTQTDRQTELERNKPNVGYIPNICRRDVTRPSSERASDRQYKERKWRVVVVVVVSLRAHTHTRTHTHMQLSIGLCDWPQPTQRNATRQRRITIPGICLAPLSWEIPTTCDRPTCEALMKQLFKQVVLHLAADRSFGRS